MTELFLGIGLGLSAGISPGPLQTLVVTTALRAGFGAGVRVAIAPLLTDTPIVIASVLAISAIPETWVRSIAIAGGLAIAALGIWEITNARANAARTDEAGGAGDMLKGAIVNLLNPHPWVFWIGVGAPTLVTAWRDYPGRAVAFLVGFYTLIVGSKIVIAGIVAAGGKRLSPEARYWLLVTGGALLVAFGVFLVARA
ncbi:MAG: LysE family transporter [Acidimicrobiia bacterium]|nr:LysE family transporter [Acidimicrobiia bacterium]